MLSLKDTYCLAINSGKIKTVVQQHSVAPGTLLLLSGDSGILVFSYKACTGPAVFHSFWAPFNFALEHSLESDKNLKKIVV